MKNFWDKEVERMNKILDQIFAKNSKALHKMNLDERAEYIAEVRAKIDKFLKEEQIKYLDRLWGVDNGKLQS